MDINFELMFFYAILACAVITLIDIAYFSRIRKRKKQDKIPLIFDYARSFLPILIVVFSLRSFAYAPYRIPSGSLKPTLLVGDFILVNKYDYGLRLPVWHKKIFATGHPERGDIVVFRSPQNPSMNLIKRVVGIPGDHIRYVNKVLYINGKQANQQFELYTTDEEPNYLPWKVAQKSENLLGVRHKIFQIPDTVNDDFEITVPNGKYFMMGDNRDDSADSRVWGFMSDQDIIGHATRVLLSFDSLTHPIRWQRTGSKII